MRLFGAGAMESNFQILFESAPGCAPWCSRLITPDSPSVAVTKGPQEFQRRAVRDM